MAARATFALKAGVWCRRARLLIVSPDSRANLARRQAETPLIALCRFPGPALILDADPPAQGVKIARRMTPDQLRRRERYRQSPAPEGVKIGRRSGVKFGRRLTLFKNQR